MSIAVAITKRQENLPFSKFRHLLIDMMQELVCLLHKDDQNPWHPTKDQGYPMKGPIIATAKVITGTGITGEMDTMNRTNTTGTAN